MFKNVYLFWKVNVWLIYVANNNVIIELFIVFLYSPCLPWNHFSLGKWKMSSKDRPQTKTLEKTVLSEVSLKTAGICWVISFYKICFPTVTNRIGIWLQKLLSFMKSHLSMLSLSCCAAGVLLRKFLPIPKTKKLLLIKRNGL
jgi:hypothetical protein